MCTQKTLQKPKRMSTLYANVYLCKHHLTLFIKPQGGLVTHLLSHPQDVHLSLIWRPRINQEDIMKLLVIFEHFEMEYKCLFKGTSWLVSVDLGVFLFWKQLVSWDLRMNLHMWVGRCESAREATCYLFVCLLMENKPGEMKCFAWKIDFSLPGNKLSVPHWPFDLLCLFEFAEVSYFILDTFRHGSTHYSEIFLSYSITFAVLTNIYRVNIVPQLQQAIAALWLICFQNDQHLSIPHHVSAPRFHRPLHTAGFLADTFSWHVSFFPPSHLLRQQLAVATGPSAFFNGGFDGRLNLVAIPKLYNVKINMSPFVHECLCNIKSLLYNWA